MAFQLWEMTSGNQVDAFATAQEAAAFIRAAIALHGRAYIDTWALAQDDGEGRPRLIASGAALADYALNPAAA